MNDNSDETELVRQLRCSVAWQWSIRASVTFIARRGQRVADVVAPTLLESNPRVRDMFLALTSAAR